MAATPDECYIIPDPGPRYGGEGIRGLTFPLWIPAEFFKKKNSTAIMGSIYTDREPSGRRSIFFFFIGVINAKTWPNR